MRSIGWSIVSEWYFCSTSRFLSVSGKWQGRMPGLRQTPSYDDFSLQVHGLLLIPVPPDLGAVCWQTCTGCLWLSWSGQESWSSWRHSGGTSASLHRRKRVRGRDTSGRIEAVRCTQSQPTGHSQKTEIRSTPTQRFAVWWPCFFFKAPFYTFVRMKFGLDTTP